MALSMATTWERSEFRYSFWESPCAWLAVMVKRSKRKMLYLFTKLPLVMVHSWPRCDPERNDLWVWGFEEREREPSVHVADSHVPRCALGKCPKLALGPLQKQVLWVEQHILMFCNLNEKILVLSFKPFRLHSY